jgi:transposase InsO family protein
VDQHVKIMQALVEQQTGNDPAPRRVLEHRVRQRVLELADRLNDHGLGLEETAGRLGVNPRTLRHWDRCLRQPDAGIAVLGRPRAAAAPPEQQAVREHLQVNGPGVSVPTLRVQFPDLARAELTRLTKAYRQVWRVEHRCELQVLHWQAPGTVWAMDFAKAPALIDGLYPYLLAVRDLASGKQLLWRPVRAETAAVVRAELVPLFLAYGAPWILKSDNGPAFRADALKGFLRQWSVFTLFSPPHTPSYNGAIEAAIGSLKTRTQRLATVAGHPELWTSGLAEAARQEANETARPRRLHGATPNEVWEARPRLSAAGREEFVARARRYQAEAREAQGPLPEGEVTHWTEAAADRAAFHRALVAHDLLLFTRSRATRMIRVSVSQELGVC